jgi:lipopolysaccharide export system permease protein
MLRQVLATLMMTVAVFTFVLLLVNVLKDQQQLVQQASFVLVLKAIALLIPFVMVFALPMGMLTAALLILGRFSADHELTATRASGISLLALVSPLLLLSVALSCVCAIINMYVAPTFRVTYKTVLAEFAIRQAGFFLPEKTFVKISTNYIVYVGKADEGHLEDILIYDLDPDGRVGSYARAERGRMVVDDPPRSPLLGPQPTVIHLYLQDAWHVDIQDGRHHAVPMKSVRFAYTNAPASQKEQPTKITDMTFMQLHTELRRLEAQTARFKSTSTIQNRRPSTLSARPESPQLSTDLTLPIRVQIHRQAAFSFACIAFTLVGIPLGIRAHRRETTFGIAVALVLVAFYYAFIFLGQSLDTRPECFPHLLVWAPNFLFQAVGIILLRRANRGI